MLVTSRGFDTQGDTQFEFGDFRLDPAEHRLLQGETLVPLAPKAFELLVALISKHGHLVTRESLMQAIWPDSFVEETNLTVNISLLRKVLGCMPGGGPWIATVPKRGYRFDGPVTALAPRNGFVPTPPSSPPAEDAADPIASGNPQPAESVASDVAQATSVLSERIGRDRVQAPSVQAPSVRSRWILAFAALPVLALCFWVAARLYDAPRAPNPDLPSTTRDTSNAQARDLYIEGRSYWNKRTLESVRKSIDLFGQATVLDPHYAAAWSGLADAWILAGSYGNSFLAPSIAMPKAKQAAEKALALDPASAEAHTSLAYIHLMWDWDFAAAEQEFKRAIELNPNYVNAHHWYSHELVALGRMADSHEESERALGLDPANVVINEHMAWHHMMAREYDRSIPQANKTIELDPGFVQAHRVLALDLLYTGRGQQACDEFEKGVQLSQNDPVATAYLARCYALTHREADARKILAGLEQASTERYVSAAEIAAVEAALHDSAAALSWLDKACDEHSASLIYLNADRVWDPLRGNPRFLADLKRVNLPLLADEPASH
jgi:DNA-binding winged helix-turn-helix (wHTH) protein/tetratricopeptide (TPR) repeat protein